MLLMNSSLGMAILSARVLSKSLSIIAIAMFRSTLVYMSTWSRVYSWWFIGMSVVLVYLVMSPEFMAMCALFLM